VPALALAIVVAGGVRSFLRGRDWRDDRSLWEASLRAGVESDRIRGNLAVALLADERPAEAVPELERALALHPCTQWRLPLANAFERTGRPAEAARQCELIRETEPRNRAARRLRGALRRASRSGSTLERSSFR
jgi:hypothetical protein